MALSWNESDGFGGFVYTPPAASPTASAGRSWSDVLFDATDLFLKYNREKMEHETIRELDRIDRAGAAGGDGSNLILYGALGLAGLGMILFITK